MSAPISPWARTKLRNRERDAAKLKASFAAVSRRSFRRQSPRFMRRVDGPLTGLIAMIIVATGVILYRWCWNSNLWPANQAILQTTSIRTCEEAQRVGIAPLYSGYPGYREGLDRDRDGIACEPYPF